MNVKTELVLFFFFLTASLFLGDGKQPFIDAWWALGILMMYGVRYYQRGKLDLRLLPRPIGWAWAALLLYSVILTPFSDSAGYSITATIRLIEGYLVYVMFATISSENTIALFTKGLLFVGVVATLASFVFLFFPALVRFLPPMNLLYATYGHNHLADVLLFIFPIAITQPWFIWVFFTVGMIFTFARGAWLLLIGYLLFLTRRSKSALVRRIGLLVAGVTVLAFLLISLGLTPIQKPSLLADGRWEYWRQSVEAIKERPFFGSGPGTFYLESKRLQSAPSSWSWFAHSAPLQITVETGVVGLVIFLVLLWNVIRQSHQGPLLRGAGLVLVYSLYEFSLDYATIWLLLWATLGLLIKHNVQKVQNSKLVVSVLTVLALFYISNISSLVASTVANNKTLAFFLAPYNENTVKDAPSSLAAFFHRKNPEVLFTAIDVSDNKFPLWAYKQALAYDLMNKDRHKAYAQLLIEQNDTTSLWDAIIQLGKLELPAHIVLRLQKIALPRLSLSTAQKDELTEPFFGTYNTNDRYSKIFFLLGLLSIDDNPKATEELWRLSRDLAPRWAHFHLELAGLYYWRLRDMTAAIKALQDCRRNIYAGPYCIEKTDNLVLLPQPGALKDKVVAIPRY